LNRSHRNIAEPAPAPPLNGHIAQKYLIWNPEAPWHG
jgi:hypothetical protein